MHWSRLSIAFAASVLLAPWALAESPDFGAALYFGTHDTGVVAEVGSGVTVPAKGFPCANCHGGRAQGGREGNRTAPSLLPSALKQRNPVYGRAEFAAAVTDGSRLSPAMPRYRLSVAQLEELFTFLETLEVRERSGVTPDTVTFGYLLADPASSHDRRILAALQRELSAVNAEKHHFGRKLQVIAVAPDEVDDAPILALLAATSSPPPGRRKDAVPWLFGLAPLPGQTGGVDEAATTTAASEQLQFKLIIDDIVAGGPRRILLVDDPTTAAQSDRVRSMCASGLCKDSGTAPPGAEGSDAYLLLTSSATAIASAVQRHGRHPAFGLLDRSAAAVPMLNRRGIAVTLADPRPDITAAAEAADETLAEANARAAVRLASALLLRTGRSLTRARMLTELRRAPFEVDGISYDYTRFPDSGHGRVWLVTFPAQD